MTTTTTTEPAASKEEQPQVEYGKNRRTGLKLLAIIVVWVGLWVALRGTNTRELGFQDTTGFHTWLNEIRDWVQLHGPDNWFFGDVLGTIGTAFDAIFEFLQKLISIPASPRPVPEIGWLGVVAIAAWLTWAVAGIRSTILVTASMLFFGIFGL